MEVQTWRRRPMQELTLLRPQLLLMMMMQKQQQQ
jgi:hypothetical protein